MVREDFESILLLEDGVPKISEDFKKCLVKMKEIEPTHQEDATDKLKIERNPSIDEETAITNSVQLSQKENLYLVKCKCKFKDTDKDNLDLLNIERSRCQCEGVRMQNKSPQHLLINNSEYIQCGGWF